MVIIGTEVFDLMRTIVKLPKEELIKDDLFQQFCHHTSMGESFVMKSEDVIPFIHSDWLNMPLSDNKHYRVDQSNNVIIFYNMDGLMYGIDEIYRYIGQVYAIDGVAVNGALISTCLEKIELCLNMDEMFDRVDLLTL
jgi:hypothetical protein